MNSSNIRHLIVATLSFLLIVLGCAMDLLDQPASAAITVLLAGVMLTVYVIFIAL